VLCPATTTTTTTTTVMTVMTDHRLRRGLAAGITAYVVWGALTLYWKLLDGFAAFELIGWRITSAALIMVAVVTARHSWPRLREVAADRRLLARVVAAALLLSSNWTAYVWAVVHDNVLETALGYFLAPLGTIAVGVIVFGERLRRLQRIAVGFGALAVTVLAVSYGRVPWLAIVLAVSWSLYGGLKKRVPLTPVESMAIESWVVVVPALVLAVALAGRPGSIPNTATWWEVLLVVFTGVATVVPLMLFAAAAQRVPLTTLGPLQYLIPTINFVLGWLVFDEALPSERLVGFALVWVGLALITVDTVRTARAAGPSTVPAPVG
jgi:chloramphenicol-sensitive protein RarD